MDEQEKFYKKVKTLISKKPKGVEIVYDSHQLRLFFIRDGFDFIDKERMPTGTSWHGVLTPVNEPNGDEGHEPNSVIGYIDIDMQAVMDGDY